MNSHDAFSGGGLLAEIVAHKREEVKNLEKTPTVRARPPPRSLRAALLRPGPRFIFELKRRSPSTGPLRMDLDPIASVLALEGLADGLSVLTDERYFGGSLEILSQVAARTSVPVLMKDFVVVPEQIVCGHSHGADAVLLLAAVLDDAELRECLAVATSLGMEALLEVHDEHELERALALPAPIIGINHRDLRTGEVDLELARRLAPRVPRERVVIAESGISTRQDVERIAPSVDAFLIGGAIMRSPDVRAEAARLATGVVKVCGLTRREDARWAQVCGARWGGLVFAAASPRAITVARAREVMEGAPGLEFVGVFTDAGTSEIASTARDLGLRAVQLAGETADIEALRAALPPTTQVWRTVFLGGADDLVTLGASELAADRVVFDTAVPGQRGGTGKKFDWNLAARHPLRERALLAGGLSPETAASARAVGCFGLDVSSGLESAPGEKSHALVSRFFDALRGASRKESAV